MFSLQAPLPRAQQREAGRSELTSDYSHEAVSVTLLGHHLPAMTQPVSPKVRSQPQLFVVALLALPRQVLCKSSCPYNTHSKLRSVVFQCLPTWLCPVDSFTVKFICVASLSGRRCLVPGMRSSSSHVWLAVPGSQVCRHTQVLHFK